MLFKSSHLAHKAGAPYFKNYFKFRENRFIELFSLLYQKKKTFNKKFNV